MFFTFLSLLFFLSLRLLSFSFYVSFFSLSISSSFYLSAVSIVILIIILMSVGSIPSVKEIELLSKALYALSLSSSSSSSSSSPFIPMHVYQTLDSIPTSVHPMTQLVVTAAALQPTSRLARAYQEKSLKKQDLWKPALYDALSLVRLLPHFHCSYLSIFNLSISS